MKVCEICGTEHAGPCTLGQKTKSPDTSNASYKATEKWLNDNNLETNSVKTRGATPYCMHYRYKDNLHDPNCPLVREKAMYFQCSFCGDVGIHQTTVLLDYKHYRSNKKGYLCSYCGAVDHTSENCSKLKENIAREKADINRRNIERYEVSNIQLKVKKIPIKPNREKLTMGDNLNKSQHKHPLLGDLIHTQEEWEGLEEGGNLLRNQMGIRISPQIKLMMKKKIRKRRIQITQ